MSLSIGLDLIERASFICAERTKADDRLRQRAHFIAIGNATNPRPKIYCLILPVSLPTLHARLQLRPTHPTLLDPETAIRVLGQMARQFYPPTPNIVEGFDLVFALPELDQPARGQWAMQDVRRVMGRIESFGEKEMRPWQSSPSFHAYHVPSSGRSIRGHR